VVTTRHLAEKVIELYWQQTRAWSSDQTGATAVLRQNNSRDSLAGGARIVRLVHHLQTKLKSNGGTIWSSRARSLDPEAWRELVDEVEWSLVEMPLPKLQRIGGRDRDWLYRIPWDDGPNKARRSEVRKWQRGQPSSFRGQIELCPGVAEAFRRLHGILRPFVLQSWSEKVGQLNNLEAARLHGFLFGNDRTSLLPVRRYLVELQSGDCFYCRERMSASIEVDHFVPWARHPDNGLHNLVAAHHRCNNGKRDYLAAVRHVADWRERSEHRSRELAQIAADVGWDLGSGRALGAARAIYLGLPRGAVLWAAVGGLQLADASSIRRVLLG
jgi:5-methylcytosine-specific restriction endonuclease McrA